MNTISKNDLPSIGAPLAGGFFAGLFLIGTEKFALIVAPKAEGQRNDIAWGEAGNKITAKSPIDGMANTLAMISAGYELGKWAQCLAIAGHTDWYIPARDELEICYRNLKPTQQENFCSYRDGENHHSAPPAEIYEEENPLQTSAEAFQDGNTEAFDERWYWSSTQYSANNAYIQLFSDGHQYHDPKSSRLRARAVRRLLVIE